MVHVMERKILLTRRLSKTSSRGIAIIFFVAVFGVLLGFFMMVANTGLLIYQKIRLQSAVDLAAYSAASVQASYLGNDQAPAEESIRGLNQLIVTRYGKLLNDLQFGSKALWPGIAPGIPDPASCAALCMAANVANGKYAEKLYKDAIADIEVYRRKVAIILKSLPEASRKAAEQTMKLNIPELAIGGGDDFASLDGGSTGDVGEVIQSAKSSGAGASQTKKKNAVLTFASTKGMYLASVVANVPHTFTYFGPACFDKLEGVHSSTRWYFCTVNGAGLPGEAGYQSAAIAYGRAFAPAQLAGNVGNLKTIGDARSHSLRLFYVPNTHKPDPFVTVSGEWYPKNGSFLNMENSLGATGSLFPKSTRLVAVASAEPFGGNLASLQSTMQFGTRLQSIRKLLLDPRTRAVKDDYPKMYDYFETLSPTDRNGNPIESGPEVIKRFLH